MLYVVDTYTGGGICVHLTTSNEIMAFLLYCVSPAWCCSFHFIVCVLICDDVLY